MITIIAFIILKEVYDSNNEVKYNFHIFFSLL